nr:MAG TPA: hypothetical protein [Caudoviricetes sp.]
MSEKIIAYKAMDKNMQCRGKQYEVGKTYHEDKADCCNAGMHACENPLDVLNYYPLKDSPRFFEVECGGNVDKSGEDSKLACTELTVKGELNFAGLVKATVNAVFNRVKGKKPFFQRLFQHGRHQRPLQHGSGYRLLLQSKSRWQRQHCRCKRRTQQGARRSGLLYCADRVRR